MSHKKVVGWIVIFAVLVICFLWYRLVLPTPLGLMPLVGCGVAIVLGFLTALGDCGKQSEAN